MVETAIASEPGPGSRTLCETRGCSRRGPIRPPGYPNRG
nr:MAG TPA: hypothetical protein [Caudoviricetes sp.]